MYDMSTSDYLHLLTPEIFIAAIYSCLGAHARIYTSYVWGRGQGFELCDKKHTIVYK